MAEKKQKKNKKSLFPYTDRELSWLSFNERVLEEAYEKENPVLERAKFLAITASNLDEFFMVRVAGLKEQVRSGYKKLSLADQTPAQQLKAIEIRAHEFCTKQYNCLTHSIIPMLRRNGILILKYDDLNEEQRDYLDKYYESTLFPVLTPLAIDQSRPFPLLSNKSLNLCVRLKKDGESHFAVVQVPSILPRFLKLSDAENDSFIMLEDVITAKLQTLFEMHQVKSVAQFRITRNSDLTIDEEADDLLIEIQKSIKKRKRGRVMAKRTQADRVLAYIQTFGSITSLEAFRDLGVTRLSARIYELRARNINIDSTSVTSKNRYGENCTYAKYYLRKEG